MGSSPWGCKESDMTKHTHTHTQKNKLNYKVSKMISPHLLSSIKGADVEGLGRR